MASQNMQLERILGFTTNGRNSFVTQPNTNNLIYIAGCVIVIFDSKTKSQSHLFTPSKQNITSLAISEDGRYLASSDCGTKAKIYIWDLKNFDILNELIGHNNEVSCMSFSTDNKFLVSVGCQQDMTLCIWEWQNELKIAAHKVQTKIRAISFSFDNSYFVTVGEAYIKYWYIQILTNKQGTSSSSSSSSCNNSTSQDSSCDSTADLNSSPNLTTVSSSISITNKSAILGEQKKNSFCDVKCGRGRMANSTFCITKSGLLCELNNKRLLHKWVDLRTLNANCLAISDNIIVIGCANGVTRCFNTTELRFLKNLPKPHPLGVVDNSNNKRPNSPQQTTSLKYPNVICVGLDEETNTISCLHNDRSIYIWNLSNPNEVVKDYSVLYHSSCIWGIDMYPMCANSILPFGSFITCSSDDTLRIWDPNVVFNNQKQTATTRLARNKDQQLKSLQNVSESLKIIFTDLSFKYLCDLECFEDKVDQNYDSNEGLRCLKVSPNGRQVAVGSRSGTIRIYNFDKDIEMKSIAAHDAEVLCLEYSNPENFDDYCYLASSSRDKLIHIFDALNDYNFLQTIDDHSSSITAIRFVNNRAKDTLQLISCSADQKIIFRNGSKKSNGDLTFMAEQIIEGKTTFYDMEVDTDSSCLMTACQDRIIRLFNVAQVKYQSGFRGSCSDEGTIIKIALDPSCTFLAASSTDKSISIYDYQRGECIASVSYGLSDLVTDLKFSCDGKHLIACSGDGCIFIWSSPAEIANAIGGSLAIVQLQKQPNHNSSSSISALRLTDQEKGDYQQQIDCKIYSNEIDELDGQLNDSINRNNDNNNKYLVQSTTKHDEYLDARPIDHQSGNGSIHNSRDENQMFVNNNMAKFFQSRDNLDRISSRKKFVNESLIYKNNEETRRLKLRGNSSLSGMFNKNILGDNLEIGNTKSLSRYTSQSQSSHALDSALDNEYGSLDNHDNGRSYFQGEVNGRDNLISPKQHIYKQNRRTNSVRGNDMMLLSDHNNRGTYGLTESSRAKSETRSQNLTPIRSSKSECNLESYACDYDDNEDDDENDQQKNIIPLNNFCSVIHGSNYCKKLNLSKCNPASVLITTELCQYIVDELQTLSKYATRLHQRLQKNGEMALCNLVARGVQNSMDILSKVPPRVSQHNQFQSQVSLSPATMLSRRRMQSPQNQIAKKNINSSSSSNMDIIHNLSNFYQRGEPPSKLRDLSRGQKSQIKDGDNSENLEQHYQQQVQTSLPRSKSNLMNIDQVLEAYSDRLFKMVQEKISEQSLGRVEGMSGNEARSEAEKQLPSMR